MGLDRRLDPTTKDYIRDGRGGYEKTATAETALHHQIFTEKAPEGGVGGWWRDAEAGSELHTLRRVANGVNIARVVEDIVERLVAPLVTAGRVTPPTITVVRASQNRTDYVVECRDTRTNSPIAAVLPSIGV